MQQFTFPTYKVALLALLAVLLGMAILWKAPIERGPGVTTAAMAATIDPITGQPITTADGVDAAAAANAAAASAAVAPAAPAPSTLVANREPINVDATPAPPTRTVELRGGVACTEPHRYVQVPIETVVRSFPTMRATRAGSVSSLSKYLNQSMTAWVQETTPDGKWGRITVPWAKPVGTRGWIPLEGLRSRTTTTMVVSDLSERRIHVYNACREVFSASTAIGRPGSPSPTGSFWVTDRVAITGTLRQSYGTFAFGLSTVQPRLPKGWSGGDQMAIHGTGAPGSIGQAASAGCLRVSESTLTRLRPLLRTGTPVIIQA